MIDTHWTVLGLTGLTFCNLQASFLSILDVLDRKKVTQQLNELNELNSLELRTGWSTGVRLIKGLRRLVFVEL